MHDPWTQAAVTAGGKEGQGLGGGAKVGEMETSLIMSTIKIN